MMIQTQKERKEANFKGEDHENLKSKNWKQDKKGQSQGSRVRGAVFCWSVSQNSSLFLPEFVFLAFSSESLGHFSLQRYSFSLYWSRTALLRLDLTSSSFLFSISHLNSLSFFSPLRPFHFQFRLFSLLPLHLSLHLSFVLPFRF